MNLSYAKSCLIIKLVYEIKSKKIRLFNKEFVNNYKGCLKMVINRKISELNDEFEIFDDKMKLLKVRIFVLNNKKINFSNMFYECDSLLDFDIQSNEEEKEFIVEKEINNIEKRNENSFEDAFNKSEYSCKRFKEDYNYQTPNNIELDSFYNNLDEDEVKKVKFNEISDINTINKNLSTNKNSIM